MYRQSPRSKGQRSNKGFKVKNGLQLILMLGVGVWLFYQTQRSYTHKDKSLGEGANVSERLRLGRKDIPDFGDAEAHTQDSGDVKFGGNDEVVNAGGSEKINEMGSEGKENGGDYGFKNKEVRMVGYEVMEEDEKARGGEMKGVVRDISWNDRVQDGSDKDEKMNREEENGFAEDASVKPSDAAKSESSDDNIDAGGDKHANMNVFSDETFASHSQNETVDNLGAKIEKGETGVDSYQSSTFKIGDSNSVEGGDSSTFSDTNGNEVANGVENPGSSSSGTYEKIQSEQLHTSHNSLSQEPKTENLQVKKDDNVSKEQHEHVKSPNKVSGGQKEDANVEHHEEVDSTISEEAKDRTDLDTLPDTDNQTHSKDAVAL